MIHIYIAPTIIGTNYSVPYRGFRNCSQSRD